MKIERVRRFNLWKVMTMLLVVSVIGLVITLKVTQAKYRYTSKMNIVNGTIHYKTGDVSVLAINIENDDGTYSENEDFPTSGYVLNTDESYCVRSVDGELVTQDVTLSYENNSLTINNITKKGTKCFLYFDKGVCDSACKTILANNTIDTSRSSGSFTEVFTDDTAGTIFSAEDDYGTTYFFAGANPNNWVKFAGFYWRIIRINGDGSIRLIYNGSDTSETGTSTQLNTGWFSKDYTDNAYVGYMYGTAGSDNYANTHANINDSTIKGVLDTWYSNNLISYVNYIDTNAGFCGDRQPSTSGTELNGSGGFSVVNTYYAPYIRVYSTKMFTFRCAVSNDLYTVSSSSYGNKALTYPIGLVSVDEVIFAGAYGSSPNQGFWLYTGQSYWTISPSRAISFATYASADPDQWLSNVFYENAEGAIGIHCTDTYGGVAGIRPVLNLKSTTTFTGSGTSSDPYIVN